MNVLGQSAAVGYRGNVPCMQAHLFRSIKDAVEGMSVGSATAPRPIWNIKAFAQIEPACRGADKLISGDTEMESVIGATTMLGLSLVILHEIAHQLLDHLEPQNPSADRLLLSRIHEDEADRWAIAKAIEVGEPFELVTPYLLIIAATGVSNVSLKGEAMSTHPSGFRRALVLLDSLADDLDMTPQMLKSVRDARRQLTQMLPR
jgi:hypothetical protein